MNKMGPIRATHSKQQAQLKLSLNPLARFAGSFMDLQVLCPGDTLAGVNIFAPCCLYWYSTPCWLTHKRSRAQ